MGGCLRYVMVWISERLYFNQDLVEAGLQRSVPPFLSSTDELDAIAQVCTKYQGQQLTQVGYLPDPRRLWAWGPAFRRRLLQRTR